MFARCKQDVAPIYRTELDRHLFATASPRRRRTRLSDERSRREWLRDRWARRFARWKAEAEGRVA